MRLTRFAWLSVGAALITIALKTMAWWLTDSVGLLSDALESLVNLATALLTLSMLALAARPPTEEHAHGYSKAEYFSGGFEGLMIMLAAVMIAYAAVERLLSPRPIDQVGLGLVISVIASLVNFGAARILLRAAHKHRSVALEADARHLMTDVWTSAGVVVGVGAVALTGWWRIDPLIALAVALNIVWIGVQLLKRAADGLLDRSMDPLERQQIQRILDSYRARGVRYHALRTREAAGRSFVTVHLLVPGQWTVKRAHDLADEIEAKTCAMLPHTSISTHIEPVDDPVSYRDIELDR